MRPYNPSKLVWALPLSLAATHGISGGSLLFLISFPMLLRWFTSHGVAPPAYFIQLSRYRNHFLWVTPFGHPRITGYLLLPAAFRSLSRPSSPRSSQASAMDLYSLDHIIFSMCPESSPLPWSRTSAPPDTTLSFNSRQNSHPDNLSFPSLFVLKINP